MSHVLSNLMGQLFFTMLVRHFMHLYQTHEVMARMEEVFSGNHPHPLEASGAGDVFKGGRIS